MAIHWLTDHIERLGDFMPHLDRIHLPPGDKIKNMFNGYTAWGAAKRQLTVCDSTFRDIFNHRFSNVKIPAVKRFMTCTICDDLRLAIKQAPNKALQKQKEKELQDHRDRFAADRMKYAKHKKKAVNNPSKYLSIAIDSMDSNKSQIPKPRRENHNTAALERLTFGVVGVICHGMLRRCRCYTYPMDFPHDANVTLQVLMDTLHDIRESNNGNLPPILYLQLDNTSRENKNRYVFGFAALLDNLGWFQKVCLFHFKSLMI